MLFRSPPGFPSGCSRATCSISNLHGELLPSTRPASLILAHRPPGSGPEPTPRTKKRNTRKLVHLTHKNTFGVPGEPLACPEHSGVPGTAREDGTAIQSENATDQAGAWRPERPSTLTPKCTHYAQPGHDNRERARTQPEPTNAAYVRSDAAPTLMTTTGAGATHRVGRLYGTLARKTSNRARFTAAAVSGFPKKCRHCRQSNPSASDPAKCAAALDHGNGSARFTNPDRAGFSSAYLINSRSPSHPNARGPPWHARHSQGRREAI